jgi:hypothetical protein
VYWWPTTFLLQTLSIFQDSSFWHVYCLFSAALPTKSSCAVAMSSDSQPIAIKSSRSPAEEEEPATTSDPPPLDRQSPYKNEKIIQNASFSPPSYLWYVCFFEFRMLLFFKYPIISYRTINVINSFARITIRESNLTSL